MPEPESPIPVQPVPVAITTAENPLPVVMASKAVGAVMASDAIRSSPYVGLLFLAIWFLWGQLEDKDKHKDETVKAVAAEHAEAVKTIVSTNAETLRQQAAVFQAEQARTERILLDRVNRNARRVEEVEKAVGQLMP